MTKRIEASDLNPYAAPTSVSDTPIALREPVRKTLMRRLISLQAIVIVASLAVEGYEHESIVGSGPIFALVGLVIAIAALWHRDYFAMVFGTSAIVFALLVVLLINFNSWSPAQGNGPITLMSFTYAAFALPISAWLVFSKTRIVDHYATG